ncbi:hypothetical protein ACS0TY_011723 [Phlomoides rotata]
MLEICVKDWGPKPFRFFNAWLSYPRFKEFVIDKWRSYEVGGWDGFVLKEKLKRLKMDIKQWNKEVFRQIDGKIEDRQNKIQELDMIDEAMGLEQHEIIQRNEERASLLYDIKCRDNILQQKARCK